MKTLMQTKTFIMPTDRSTSTPEFLRAHPRRVTIRLDWPERESYEVTVYLGEEGLSLDANTLIQNYLFEPIKAVLDASKTGVLSRVV